MLASNPRISQLAALAKLYAPLSLEKEIESLRLLRATEDFEDLPLWLKENLLLTEELKARDQASTNKLPVKVKPDKL